MKAVRAEHAHAKGDLAEKILGLPTRLPGAELAKIAPA